jgi:hypothetical protein
MEESGIKRRRQLTSYDQDDIYDIEEKHDMSIFFRAIVKKDDKIIRVFIDNNWIDPDFLDIYDSNAVMISIKHDNLLIAIELLEKFNFNHSIMNSMNETILSLLLEKNLDKNDLFSHLFKLILSKNCNINNSIKNHTKNFINIIDNNIETIINYNYEVIKNYDDLFLPKIANIIFIDSNLDKKREEIFTFFVNYVLNNNYSNYSYIIQFISTIIKYYNKNCNLLKLFEYVLDKYSNEKYIEYLYLMNLCVYKEYFNIIIRNKNIMDKLPYKSTIIYHGLSYKHYDEILLYINLYPHFHFYDVYNSVIKSYIGTNIYIEQNPKFFKVLIELYKLGYKTFINKIKSVDYDINRAIIEITKNEYSKYFADEYLINFISHDEYEINIVNIFCTLDMKDDAIKFAKLGVNYEKNKNLGWFNELENNVINSMIDDNPLDNKDKILLEIIKKQNEIKKQQEELDDMIKKLSIKN